MVGASRRRWASRLGEIKCGGSDERPMRADITPGGIFPDFELVDHTATRCRLSELQGHDPMIVVLARGHYCPKDHQQHVELAALYSKIAVAYTQIVTISTDDILRTREFRASRRCAVDVPLRRWAQGAEGARHTGVHRPVPRSHGPAHVGAQAEACHPQRLQRILVLGKAFDRRAVARSSRGDTRGTPRLGPRARRASALPGRPATARGSSTTSIWIRV